MVPDPQPPASDSRFLPALALTVRLSGAGVALLAPGRLVFADPVPGERPAAELLGLFAVLAAFALEARWPLPVPPSSAGRVSRALLGVLAGLLPLALHFRSRDATVAVALGSASAVVAAGVALAPAFVLRAAAPTGAWRSPLVPIGLAAGTVALGAAVFTPEVPRLADLVAAAFLGMVLVGAVAMRNPLGRPAGAAVAEAMRVTKLGGVHQFQLWFMFVVLTFLFEPTRPGVGGIMLFLAVVVHLSLVLRVGGAR